LNANNLIQSDDRIIKSLAASVLPDETDNWKLAAALENAVYRKMTAKNFSTAFATAAEVARSFEGDCTEHAVLLVALCRARGIPARVAVGLVYYAPQRGFAFHMWNEVWTGDRWVPLDATLGRGGIGAAHLKLADSSLAGADSFSAFMPVAKVMGQLEIEVQEVDSFRD
jgi:transglutaminase-like putative cysteine protease